MMRRARDGFPVLLLLYALGAGAAASEVPLPPVKPDRSGAAAESAELAGDTAPQGVAVPVPPPRPDRSVIATVDAGREPVEEDRAALLTGSPPLPPTKPTAPPPARIVIDAQPKGPLPQPKRSAAALLCKDPRLVGEPVFDLEPGTGACGIHNPVSIREIAGVSLSRPARLNCTTARRVADWLTGVADPAARANLGSGIKKIWVMASYACRTRNNRPGGKLSEHARGRAIDIGGVWLGDGRQITVARHWGGGKTGAFLRESHARACGLFQTVLGPKADRHHRDHFHFDTSARGGDPYCR